MKTALIFASSGLIGNELLNYIVQNNSYNSIKLFVNQKIVFESNEPNEIGN